MAEPRTQTRAVGGGVFAPAFTANRDQAGEPLTVELLLDAIGPIYAEPPKSLQFVVSIPMANKLDRWGRKGDALRLLGINPDSTKARKVTARGNRWPE